MLCIAPPMTTDLSLYQTHTQKSSNSYGPFCQWMTRPHPAMNPENVSSTENRKLRWRVSSRIAIAGHCFFSLTARPAPD